MTKFEELCAAFKDAQSGFEKYRDDCHEFAVELWNRMIEYFQIPPSQLSLYRVNEQEEFEATSPPMFNALTLREDAYWQVGFGITLYEAQNTYPQETVIVGLLIRRENGSNFMVKLWGQEEEYAIDRSKPEDFNHFFEHLHNTIRESYQQGLQTFLDQETTIRKIGFKFSEGES